MPEALMARLQVLPLLPLTSCAAMSSFFLECRCRCGVVLCLRLALRLVTRLDIAGHDGGTRQCEHGIARGPAGQVAEANHTDGGAELEAANDPRVTTSRFQSSAPDLSKPRRCRGSQSLPQFA